MAQEVGKLMVKVGADTRDAEDGLKRVHASFKDAALGGAGFAAGMQAVNTGFHLLSEGLSSTISVAANFQHSIAQVGAVAGATKEQLSQIAEAAKKIGFETTFTATEASQAMEILAANGVSLKDILNGAADAAVSLAAAGGTSLATAADTVSTAMAAWGASTAEMEDYINRIAGAANVSRFGVEDMSQAIAQGGGVAAAAGVEFADFAAVIAATASSFSSGADAGTSFKTFIQRLAAPTGDAAEMMKRLGISAYDSTGAMRPMGEIVEQLNKSLGSMTEAERTNAASIIFGTDAMRTALGLAGMTREEFEKLYTTMGNTSAAEVAKQRMTDYEKAMGEFKGSVENLQIALGEKLLPVLADLASWGSTAVPKFADFLGDISAEPLSMLAGAFETAKNAASGFFDWMGSHQGVTKALAEGLVVVTAAMVAFAVASAAAALANPFTAMMLAIELVSAAIIYLVTNWDDLTQRFPLLGQAADAAVTAFDGIVDAFNIFTDALSYVNDALDATGNKWEILSLAFGPIGLAVVEVIAHFDDLKSALYSLIDAWDDISSYSFGDLFGDIGDVLGQVTEELSGMAGDWYDAGMDAGGELIDGVKEGIESKGGDIKDWVQENLNPMNWGWHSPLDESMRIDGEAAGQAFDEGLASGFDGGQAVAAITGYIGTVAQCIDNGAQLIKAAADKVRAAIGSMMGGDFGDGTYTSSFDLIEYVMGGGNSGVFSPFTGPQASGSKPKPKPGSFGGGGGGGGSGAKDAGKSAYQEFEDAFKAAADQGSLISSFGDLGAKAISAFHESFDNPKAASKLPDYITQLVDQAKAAGVPNAKALGDALSAAIADGLQGGSVDKVWEAMHALTDAVTQAGQLTVSSFHDAMAKAAADDALTSSIGNVGTKLLDNLTKALEEGGKKATDALTNTVSGLMSAMRDKLPEGEAAFLGTKLMQGLDDAINGGGEAAIAALKNVLAQINNVMSGGALDWTTGFELSKKAVDEMAKAFGVSAKTIQENIKLIQEAGLDQLDFSHLPKAMQKAVSETLKNLQDGKISVERALLELAATVGSSANAISTSMTNVGPSIAASMNTLISNIQTAMMVLNTNLASGVSMTASQIQTMMDGISGAIKASDLPAAAKETALGAMKALADGFASSGSLANDALIKVLDALLAVAKAKAAEINGTVASAGSGGGNKPGGGGGGGGGPVGGGNGLPKDADGNYYFWDGPTLYVVGPGGVAAPAADWNQPYIDQNGHIGGQGAGGYIDPRTGQYVPPLEAKPIITGPKPVPKYATGTPWVPNDGLAYLHKGEAVLTRKQNEDRMGGGGAPVVFAPVITAIDAEGVRAVMPTLAREFQAYLKDRGLTGFGL